MACSTMRGYCTEQTTAVSWKIKVSPGEPFGPANPNNTYIRAVTTEEVKKKIVSTIESYLRRQNQSVVVQYWAAEGSGKKIVLLTTTCQPFGVCGNNKQLQAYRNDCLHHKLYVFRDDKKEAAFGLAGRAYLYCTPQPTEQNYKEYHPKEELCEKTVFTKKWGSFAVPVFHANKCIGVLDFVMDTLKDSYNRDIDVVQTLLQHVGLPTPNQIDCPKRTYVDPEEEQRVTFTNPITSYDCLAQFFGLSIASAVKKLAKLIGGRELGETTFRYRYKKVGIPEWPYIRNTTAGDSTDEGSPESSVEQTMTSTDSDTWLPGPGGSMADNGEMEYHSNNVDHHPYDDLNSIISEKLGSPAGEQTLTTDFDDACQLELSDPGFMADFGEMGYLEDIMNVDHMNADFNYSIRDQGFSEQPIEHVTTRDWIEFQRNRSDFMADFGEIY